MATTSACRPHLLAGERAQEQHEGDRHHEGQRAILVVTIDEGTGRAPERRSEPPPCIVKMPPLTPVIPDRYHDGPDHPFDVLAFLDQHEDDQRHAEDLVDLDPLIGNLVLGVDGE